MNKSVYGFLVLTLLSTIPALAEPNICSDDSPEKIPPGSIIRVTANAKNELLQIPFSNQAIWLGKCRLSAHSVNSRDNRKIMPRPLKIAKVDVSRGYYDSIDILFEDSRGTLKSLYCPKGAEWTIEELQANLGGFFDFSGLTIPAKDCHKTIEAVLHKAKRKPGDETLAEQGDVKHFPGDGDCKGNGKGDGDGDGDGDDRAPAQKPAPVKTAG